MVYEMYRHCKRKWLSLFPKIKSSLKFNVKYKRYMEERFCFLKNMVKVYIDIEQLPEIEKCGHKFKKRLQTAQKTIIIEKASIKKQKKIVIITGFTK